MSLNDDSDRISGQDIRIQNVTACLAVSNIIRSSLGPVGLDKMLVDDIGDVTITNDGATILKLLNIEHPAAKVLLELSELQDKEVGDGTTSVVLIAVELLRRGLELYKQGIHPTTIINGYKIGMKESIRFIKQNCVIKSDVITDEVLLNVAKTSMSSKIIGNESFFFAKLVVDAVRTVKTDNSYNIDNIKILKCHGKSSLESELIPGIVLDTTRASLQMPIELSKVKIALLDMDINRYRTQLGKTAFFSIGVQIVIENPEEVEKIKEKEDMIVKDKISKVLDAGANLILCTGGMDDLVMKYLVERKCIGCRRVNKVTLQQVAQATGSTILTSLSDMEGNETFDVSCLGYAERVAEETVGDGKTLIKEIGQMLYITGGANIKSSSIVVRGCNEYMLNEIERSIHDSLCTVKRVLESKSLVVGGGCVDAALAVHLSQYALTLGTRAQLAVLEFAESLLVIPRILIGNSGKDVYDILSKLYSKHTMVEKQNKKEFQFFGLDLLNGQVIDNFKAGVLEPALSKVNCIRFATEAAITIMRIDDMIKIQQQEGQENGSSTPPIL